MLPDSSTGRLLQVAVLICRSQRTPKMRAALTGLRCITLTGHLKCASHKLDLDGAVGVAVYLGLDVCGRCPVLGQSSHIEKAVACIALFRLEGTSEFFTQRRSH